MTKSEISRRRCGLTLVELLIVLAIIGILAAVATPSIRSIGVASPDDPRQMLADSARIAAGSARVVRVSLVLQGRRVRAALGPDGSVVADSAFGAEVLIGAGPYASRD